MTITGKRHDFRIDYEAGFDDEGRILGWTWCWPRVAATAPTTPAR
jgi:xanthine dehydrogenase molybdopterin-binding subunit B